MNSNVDDTIIQLVTQSGMYMAVFKSIADKHGLKHWDHIHTTELLFEIIDENMRYIKLIREKHEQTPRENM
jgi:hypothetical protein